MSAPAPPSYLPPHEVNQAKINRAEDPGQNYQHRSSIFGILLD